MLQERSVRVVACLVCIYMCQLLDRHNLFKSEAVLFVLFCFFVFVLVFFLFFFYSSTNQVT